ncbi:MAG: hypothetical protein E7301_12970 [Butyrivibrio sp.]|nr:hypothetical protein [Butyrivibrio sp.]
MKNNSNKQNRMPFNNSQNLISIIFLGLVSVLALSYCIATLLSNASLKRQLDAAKSELAALESEGYYTKAETDQMIEIATNEVLENAGDSVKERFKEDLIENGTSDAIKNLFPGQIVLSYGNEYQFFDISEDIDRSSFLETDFEMDKESGFLEYTGIDESVVFTRGIDISRAQGDIDFSKVKASGIDYCMIRAGLRGSTEGTVLEDDLFKTYVEKARDAGLDVGVYFYSQAIDATEAREEARFVLDLIEPYDITYPVAIDIEANESSDARTFGQTPDVYKEVANAFLSTVEASGYTPMIYGNTKTFVDLLQDFDINNYAIWISDHNIPIYYPYRFDMWQYSGEGNIDGIEGSTNINICVTDFAE